MNEFAGCNSLSVADKSKLLFEKLSSSEIYWSLRSRVKEELLKTSCAPGEMMDIIPRLIKELNLETELKNEVFKMYMEHLKHEGAHIWAYKKFKECEDVDFLPSFYLRGQTEQLECIIQAKQIWSDFVKQRFQMLQKSVFKPAVRQRIIKQEGEKTTEGEAEEKGGDDDENESSVRPVIYEPSTLLNAILKMKSGNYAGSMSLFWGSIKVLIHTKSVDELRRKFSELAATMRQIGVDDEKSFIDERILIGERLLAKYSVPFLMQFAKRGVPNGIRCQVYLKILGLTIGEKEMWHLDKLAEHISKWEILTDDVIKLDLKEVNNDDKYFVFDETINTVTQYFFRDSWVLDHCRMRPHTPLVGYIGDSCVGTVPPCGVLPCFLFARYVCPFAYMSDRIADIYFAFRSIYCKYICCLHTIGADPQSILGLSKLFEELLQAYEPEVVYHMQQVGLSPLRIAYPWIFYGFIGYLEVDQLFLIWDRILGFDSLEILPILAASIMVYRANLIMSCQTQEEFDEIFYDLSQFKVIPLIQHFLFLTATN